MNDTNQWLLDGDCSKCRRQSYCRKACGAVKRAYRSGFKQALAAVLKEKMKEKKEE